MNSFVFHFAFLHSRICSAVQSCECQVRIGQWMSGALCVSGLHLRAQALKKRFVGSFVIVGGLPLMAPRGLGAEVLVNTLCPASHVDGLP